MVANKQVRVDIRSGQRRVSCPTQGEAPFPMRHFQRNFRFLNRGGCNTNYSQQRRDWSNNGRPRRPYYNHMGMKPRNDVHLTPFIEQQRMPYISCGNVRGEGHWRNNRGRGYTNYNPYLRPFNNGMENYKGESTSDSKPWEHPELLNTEPEPDEEYKPQSVSEPLFDKTSVSSSSIAIAGEIYTPTLFNSEDHKENLQKIVFNYLRVGVKDSNDSDEMSVLPVDKPTVLKKSADEIEITSLQADKTYLMDGDFHQIFVSGHIKWVVNGSGLSNPVATFGLWRSNSNLANRGEKLPLGRPQCLKAACILGAERAISLMKLEGYSKIRISVDSEFMLQNVLDWVKKYQDDTCRGNFSNWDEYKYSEEIDELCASMRNMIVKWTIVRGNCYGIRQAKTLAKMAVELS